MLRYRLISVQLLETACVGLNFKGQISIFKFKHLVISYSVLRFWRQRVLVSISRVQFPFLNSDISFFRIHCSSFWRQRVLVSISRVQFPFLNSDISLCPRITKVVKSRQHKFYLYYLSQYISTLSAHRQATYFWKHAKVCTAVQFPLTLPQLNCLVMSIKWQNSPTPLSEHDGYFRSFAPVLRSVVPVSHTNPHRLPTKRRAISPHRSQLMLQKQGSCFNEDFVVRTVS